MVVEEVDVYNIQEISIIICLHFSEQMTKIIIIIIIYYMYMYNSFFGVIIIWFNPEHVKYM